MACPPSFMRGVAERSEGRGESEWSMKRKTKLMQSNFAKI